MRSLILQFVLLLGASLGLKAQIEEPVKWTFSAEKTGVNTYVVSATGSMEKYWHIYSIKGSDKPDEGPISSSLTFDKGQKITLGKLEEPKPKQKFDEGFEMNVRYFENTVTFKQKVTLVGPTTSLKGVVNFQACIESPEKSGCIAPQDVDFNLPVVYEDVPNNGSNIISPTIDNTKPNVDWKTEATWKRSEGTNDIYTVLISGPGSPRKFQLSTDTKEARFDKAITPTLTQSKDSWAFIQDLYVPQGSTSVDVKLLDDTTAIGSVKPISLFPPSKSINQGGSNEKDTSGKLQATPIDPRLEETSGDLGLLFIASFASGLLALLTPCVFPMIPLTVSFFTKKNASRTSGIFKALLFGGFIIGIYTGFGLLVTILLGPDVLNEMSSNRVFNLIFFAVFVIFALSFFGAFELKLPASWATQADRHADKGGILGVFFVAFTLVLVSFSCTGPIIGSLLFQASVSGGVQGPAIGMFGFSLALALPFTIFAFFPSLMTNLPRSGGWLNNVKISLGFVELALALKFLVVPDQAYHWGLLKREYFLVLWIIVFALWGFYLLGKLRFKHDSPIESISIFRLILAIFTFGFATYMIPGLFGAPVQLLSGLAPPWQDNEGFITPPMVALSPPALTDVRPIKYTDFLKSPYGLIAFFDLEEAKNASKQSGKPILVDFTGHGCTNCRKMEEGVWRDAQVLTSLNNSYVLLQLYVDDRSELPEGDIYTSAKTGKTINTLGRKWSDVQATLFGANSQPYYAIIDHHTQLLVKPRGYDPPTVESFLTFLSQGIAAAKVNKEEPQVQAALR